MLGKGNKRINETREGVVIKHIDGIGKKRGDTRAIHRQRLHIYYGRIGRRKFYDLGKYQGNDDINEI